MASLSGESTLEMVRVLPVETIRLFAAVDDPAELRKWFGPKGFGVGSIDFDPRIGGTYRIEMQPPDGDSFYLGGEFRHVDPPSRLAFTFAYEDPDPDDVETVVELRFRARGESTELAFTQGPFRTDARRELHRAGWTDSFDKLAQIISQQP
jgi:uncharacterized protein YndB with AHSA1/START domain